MGTFLLKCHRCAIPFNSAEIWEVMIEKEELFKICNLVFLGGEEIFKKTNFHISTLVSDFHEAFGYDLPKTVFASGTLQ